MGRVKFGPQTGETDVGIVACDYATLAESEAFASGVKTLSNLLHGSVVTTSLQPCSSAVGQGMRHRVKAEIYVKENK